MVEAGTSLLPVAAPLSDEGAVDPLIRFSLVGSSSVGSSLVGFPLVGFSWFDLSLLVISYVCAMVSTRTRSRERL